MREPVAGDQRCVAHTGANRAEDDLGDHVVAELDRTPGISEQSEQPAGDRPMDVTRGYRELVERGTQEFAGVSDLGRSHRIDATPAAGQTPVALPTSWDCWRC